MPHGLSITRAGAEKEDWLGSVFSDVPIGSGDVFSRPTAGGGGFGDPLERDPALVLEDVADDYVSVERAAKDYGVVLTVVDAEICAYAVDQAATKAMREAIRRDRIRWLATDPEEVAAGYRNGTIDRLDVVRRYAVVLDWDTGALLPVSTGQFREMFHKRTAAVWAGSGTTETFPLSEA
jgi:N-methylhydantoinase B